MKKPNIIFLFTDDQRFDTISALGNDKIITPNLDRLVKRGTSYTHAHIPSGTSAAVCMPSRAMLNTGRNLFSLTNAGSTVDPCHSLLGETLHENGYSTFATGKWHNGTDAFKRSFTNGAEIFFGGMEDHWNVPANHFDPTGKYESRAAKIRNPFESKKEIINICDHVTPGKHSSQLFADATIDFINNHTTDNPFYAYVSFMAPHDPRSMPKEFLDMYDIDDIELPQNFMSYHYVEYNNTQCRDEILAPYPRTEQDTKEQILEYYAMITHIDYEIGKILNTLDENNMMDDTIIIFAGDNGLAMGQHGLFGKQCHFDHSIRVPFMISGKDIPKDAVKDDYIYLLDIYPTLCDLLDIEIPESVEGRSFYKGLMNDVFNPRETLYFAYTDKIRSVKNKQFKLMQHVHDGKITTQLFDLINDPYEMCNIINQEKYSDVVDLLHREIIQYRDNWNELNTKWGESYWNQYTEIKSNIS